MALNRTFCCKRATVSASVAAIVAATVASSVAPFIHSLRESFDHSEYDVLVDVIAGRFGSGRVNIFV